MKNLLFALLLALTPGVAFATQGAPRYAVAEGPTPVLNTPAVRSVFGGAVRLDPCKGVRPIEFIALPGTLFRIEGAEVNDGVTVYHVSSHDYPYPSETGYFVDARFLREVAPPFPERPRVLPGLAEVQQRLLAALGRPYVWGGNLRDGVPLLGKLYPGAETLAGVDCSGLLYEATGGYTPRNSSALTAFGAGVPIAGLPPDLIAGRLQPLDLIVWKGHVVIVLDRDRVIESRKPLDDYPAGGAGGRAFVIRRWFPR
jgi:hypothetical protein